MTHVRRSPYYPQINGKIERWHQSLKTECIPSFCQLSLDEARRIVENFVHYCNAKHLPNAIGYVTPRDKLDRKERVIFAERDREFHGVRERRRQTRIEAKEDFQRALAQATSCAS